MNKTFLDYLGENEKTYSYTLKIAANLLEDNFLEKLEFCLEKYGLVSASDIKKTLIQESPLDFPNISNSSVFITELKLSYPASRDMLENYISKVTGINEQAVVVYSENDPRKTETDLFLERTSEDYRKNYKTSLGNEYEQIEFETHQESADKLLKELENNRKSRKIKFAETPLSVEQKIDTVKDYDVYNDNLDNNSLSVLSDVKKTEVKHG